MGNKVFILKATLPIAVPGVAVINAKRRVLTETLTVENLHIYLAQFMQFLHLLCEDLELIPTFKHLSKYALKHFIRLSVRGQVNSSKNRKCNGSYWFISRGFPISDYLWKFSAGYFSLFYLNSSDGTDPTTQITPTQPSQTVMFMWLLHQQPYPVPDLIQIPNMHAVMT